MKKLYNNIIVYTLYIHYIYNTYTYIYIIYIYWVIEWQMKSTQRVIQGFPRRNGKRIWPPHGSSKLGKVNQKLDKISTLTVPAFSNSSLLRLFLKNRVNHGESPRPLTFSSSSLIWGCSERIPTTFSAHIRKANKKTMLWRGGDSTGVGNCPILGILDITL